jgi:hypothetical protein
MKPLRLLPVAVSAMLLAISTLTGLIGAEAGVIVQDDFETPSLRNPPPGWAMWGAEKFKVPANYTLDSSNPHSGRQCFRIYHPANTGGYIVLAPERAIRSKPAMIYTVSFWARTDQPGRAIFQWTAYQTINPFTDAPSPGSLPFHAGLEWKEFTFLVREGLDFFADQSRFLLLTFNASTDQKLERTLYIDDVQVSEEPDPSPAALLEPSSSLWGHGQAFPTSEAFIEHFRTVSRAIRLVDPKAQIGMDINVEQVRWGNYLLKQLAGCYDFVAPHYYCGADVHTKSFEDIVLTENYRMLDRALRVQALLRAYNPDREVAQNDTEWGMICSAADGKDADFEDRNANIIGTIHRAVRLIYYAREGLLQGASGWQMLSRFNAQGFGILSQDTPNQQFMLYWLYYYFNRHLGEWALLTDGTAPYHQPGESNQPLAGPMTPTLASLSNDGRQIYLVIANGSGSRAVPCHGNVRGFGSFRAVGVVLTNDDLNGKPLLKQKQDAVSDLPLTVAGEDVICTLPPHSVVFVTLTKS